MRGLDLSNFHWMERRRYTLDCNWKVFVDNYLDGGYHVPYLHKGLDSVLDYGNYTIETGERFCLQSSPVVAKGAEAQTGAVRKGDRAFYYWIYPNLMINWYEGVMDTNLVIPRGIDRTEVIFDFYFHGRFGAGPRTQPRQHRRRLSGFRMRTWRSASRFSAGLQSRSYTAGRLSVRREAGEHLFHQLLYADLRIWDKLTSTYDLLARVEQGDEYAFTICSRNIRSGSHC